MKINNNGHLVSDINEINDNLKTMVKHLGDKFKAV